jgi:hypothetical protein
MSKHPHTWVLIAYLARRMCSHCGLLWLRNPRSDEAARQSCRWWDE